MSSENIKTPEGAEVIINNNWVKRSSDNKTHYALYWHSKKEAWCYSAKITNIDVMAELQRLEMMSLEMEQFGIPSTVKSAKDLLSAGAELLGQRGAEYDKNGNSERSFNAVATAFNAITGKDITPAEVCLMLQVLKDVRQWANPERLHEDSVVDGVNYAALKGEELYKQYRS